MSGRDLTLESLHKPEDIFERAAERAREMGLPYAGAITPAEAHALREAGAAAIVDVRTPGEWQHVGHVEGAPLIEWPRDGDEGKLTRFLAELRERYPPEQPLLFLCRSGVRSHYAAHLAARAGFAHTYNVLEGFEGAHDPRSGWRGAGLPWKQG